MFSLNDHIYCHSDDQIIVKKRGRDKVFYRLSRQMYNWRQPQVKSPPNLEGLVLWQHNIHRDYGQNSEAH